MPVKGRIDSFGLDYERLIEKEHKPIGTEIMNFVGKPANEVWMELKRFLGRNYDIDRGHGAAARRTLIVD